MENALNVYALPSLVTPDDLVGATAVVIDVLRASTTMVFALEAGAREILPCLEVEEARQAAAGLPADEVVLGGERGGVRIEGFHLGNSPTEYTVEAVSNRTVVFTTTNGTRALLQCRQAQRVLIGAFVNAAAVVQQLAGQEKIALVCAGTAGEYSRDDVLLAGFLVELLQKITGQTYQLNVQALTARENWASSFAIPYTTGAERLPADVLARQLRTSLGGRNLTAVGLDADILTAAEIDRFQSVPELDLQTFRVRLPHG